MVNLMILKNLSVFENVIEKQGGRGACSPRKILEICIANGSDSDSI